jgi:hypothetical protein
MKKLGQHLVRLGFVRTHEGADHLLQHARRATLRAFPGTLTALAPLGARCTGNA